MNYVTKEEFLSFTRRVDSFIEEQAEINKLVIEYIQQQDDFNKTLIKCINNLTSKVDYISSMMNKLIK